MAVLVPRIRTINVRLSEAEYLELERLCVAKGARSLSDLVRQTIHDLVAFANQESVLAFTVNQHSAQVKELEQEIERLSAEVASLRADSPKHDTGRPAENKDPLSSPKASEDQPAVDYVVLLAND